jgi:hypothetical protein
MISSSISITISITKLSIINIIIVLLLILLLLPHTTTPYYYLILLPHNTSSTITSARAVTTTSISTRLVLALQWEEGGGLGWGMKWRVGEGGVDGIGVQMQRSGPTRERHNLRSQLGTLRKVGRCRR